MLWRSHALIGGIFGLIAALLFGFSDFGAVFLFIAIASLSALVPDLDHHASKGRQWLDKTIPIGAFLFSYLEQCGSEICTPTPTIVQKALGIIGVYFILFTYFKPKHRGITHSIFGVLLYGALLAIVLNLNIAIAGMAGYLSHLIADKELKII